MKHLIKICVCFYVLVLIQYVDSNCTFPSALQNAAYISSNFGTLQFQVSTFDYAEDGVTSWSCLINEGDIYIARSEQIIQIFGFDTYLYYCFSLTQETDYSFSYYLLSIVDHGKRRKPWQTHITATVANVCDDTLHTAEFHVMVNSASPELAKAYCASPLLGDFSYTFYDHTTSSEKCGSLPGDGDLAICTNDSRNEMVFNYTACSEQVGYSTGGVLYCIAHKSDSSGGTYYQSLYNADSSAGTQFTCMVISSSTDAGGTARVYVSQSPTACLENQTSILPHNSTGDTLVLTATVTCPIVEAADHEGVNIGLIIGLVVGAILLLAIIAGLLFYFCYWKKRGRKDEKPIVENTKPRFEDPDEEDSTEDVIDLEDNASTIITRDDIAFEAGSPNLVPNGKPISLTNGTMTANLNKGSYVMFNGNMKNGSLANDSGIAMTEVSSERPIPRIGLNQSKEAMVIFNGDEKVISGNDSRVIPADNPNARTFRTMDTKPDQQDLTLFLDALEENEAGDSLGELSHRDLPYPSLPREKSNLMPPIETIDPEKDKTED